MRRRYRVALITFLLLLGPALIPGLTVEPVYVGEAKVAIERTPEIMVFGGDFMPRLGDTARGASIETVIMESDRVLGRALDQVPAPPPPAEAWSSRTIRRVRSLLGLGGTERPVVDPSVQRYGRIRGLRGKMELTNNAGVVTISVKNGDPGRAVLLANAVADAYVEYDRENRREASQQALSWLNQRAAELRGRVLSTREAMASISDRLGVVPPPLDGGPGGERRQELTKDLERLRLELFATEQRQAQLEPGSSRSGKAEPPTAESVARQQEYIRLRAELEEARLLYTPTHPELRRLEEAVAQLERSLPRAEGNAAAGDPLALEKLRERERLGTEIAVLRARIRSIEEMLDGMINENVENATEIANYHRLRRDVELDEQLLSTVQQRVSATVLSAARESATVRVLDYAILPGVAGGQMLLFLAVGVMAAAGMGGGVALLLELLDRREYDSSQAAAALGTPILARIPEMDPEELDPSRLATEGTVGAEALRRLCTALVYSGLGQEVRALAVVSAVAGEGKTTVSTSLAAAIAQTGRAVVVLDADMRRPRVNAALGLPRALGLSDVLSGRAKLRDVIRSPKTLRFDVVTSGEIPDNPTELLSKQAFAQVLEELRGIYDVAIVDSPVLLAVSDALLVAAQADGVLVVHRSGMAESDAFPAVAVDLRRVRARIVGVVANCVPPTDTYAYPAYLKSPYAISSPSSRRRSWWRPFSPR